MKRMSIKISEPFTLTEGDVDFPVDGIMSACHIVVEGLNEPEFDLYGMDSMQATNIASNIDPYLERLSSKYDFYWTGGEPYFDSLGD